MQEKWAIIAVPKKDWNRKSQSLIEIKLAWTKPLKLVLQLVAQDQMSSAIYVDVERSKQSLFNNKKNSMESLKV